MKKILSPEQLEKRTDRKEEQNKKFKIRLQQKNQKKNSKIDYRNKKEELLAYSKCSSFLFMLKSLRNFIYSLNRKIKIFVGKRIGNKPGFISRWGNVDSFVQ